LSVVALLLTASAFCVVCALAFVVWATLALLCTRLFMFLAARDERAAAAVEVPSVEKKGVPVKALLMRLLAKFMPSLRAKAEAEVKSVVVPAVETAVEQAVVSAVESKLGK